MFQGIQGHQPEKRVRERKSMGIFLRGCLFESMKKFKYFIVLTLFFSFFVPTSWAQQDKRPWAFEGENFQITNDLGDNHLPSVAFGNSFISFYLAVWSRKTPSGFDIYGTRITKNGDIVDEEGIPICTAPNDQMFPSVLWDGENFFVVWQDMRNGKRWDIYGARVSLDGQVFPPDGISVAIGKSSNDQVAPVISFDGENYLIVWQGRRTSKTWNIYFTKVSKGLEVLEEKPVPVSPSIKDQASPAVAFDGENYFIVWQDKRGGKFWDMYGARVAPSGEILDTKGTLISPIPQRGSYGWDKWRPVVSWDGISFLVIWMASQEKGKWYLEGKRVRPDGVPEGLLDTQIQKDTTNKTYPSFLIWEEEPEGDSKIFGAFIIPDYRLLTSDVIRVSTFDGTDTSLPALSKAEDDILVVWQAKGQEGTYQIFGQRFKKAPLE
jgi:hypothetical protein